jgi:hypothetical protein
VGWTALGLFVLTALVAGINGTGEDGLAAAARTTARTSLLLFLAVYSASPLYMLLPGRAGRWQLNNRRYLGLSFAVSHGFHAVAIVTLSAATPHESYDPATLAAGGLGYLFVAAMAATSFDRSADWIGRKNWRRLHVTGLHLLWLVFALTYLDRSSGDPLAVVALGLLLAAAALRLYRRFAGA